MSASKSLPSVARKTFKHVRLPEAIINRAGDNWVPLFTIANVVGGEWPRRVRAAALDYEKYNPTQDRGILLLSNLKTIIDSTSKDFYSSQELCTALTAREDWQWGEYGYGGGITSHALARLLRPFSIYPKQERMAEKQAPGRPRLRGYDRMDFEKAWQAYGIQGEHEGLG